MSVKANQAVLGNLYGQTDNIFSSLTGITKIQNGDKESIKLYNDIKKAVENGDSKKVQQIMRDYQSKQQQGSMISAANLFGPTKSLLTPGRDFSDNILAYNSMIYGADRPIYGSQPVLASMPDAAMIPSSDGYSLNQRGFDASRNYYNSDYLEKEYQINNGGIISVPPEKTHITKIFDSIDNAANKVKSTFQVSYYENGQDPLLSPSLSDWSKYSGYGAIACGVGGIVFPPLEAPAAYLLYISAGTGIVSGGEKIADGVLNKDYQTAFEGGAEVVGNTLSVTVFKSAGEYASKFTKNYLLKKFETSPVWAGMFGRAINELTSDSFQWNYDHYTDKRLKDFNSTNK
jgi:hypothetical protein